MKLSEILLCGQCRRPLDTNSCPCGWKLPVDDRLLFYTRKFHEDSSQIIKKTSLIHQTPHDHKRFHDWKLILDFLRKNIQFIPGFRVLDLGTGAGNIPNFALTAIKDTLAIGLDINSSYLRHMLKRNPRIVGLVRDINERLPFRSESFDLVSCTGTLHYSYIDDPFRIISEMRRVSRNYVFIDFLSRVSPYVLFERCFNPSYRPKRYGKKSVNQILAKLGLKPVGIIGGRTLPFINKYLPFSGKTVYVLAQKINVK